MDNAEESERMRVNNADLEGDVLPEMVSIIMRFI
jgi:hypothetical protein